MSDDNNDAGHDDVHHESGHPPPPDNWNQNQPAQHEPIFNIPGFIIAFGGILIAIHLAGEGGFIERLTGTDHAILNFYFNPYFYNSAPELERLLISVSGVRLWSPFTHSLLHGSWMHLFTNLLWMLAFGSVVARRFGTARTVSFALAASLGGSAFHFAAYPFANIPMIGASGIVSGFMGAACRFAFTGHGIAKMDANAPALSLAQTFSNRQTLVFIGLWFFLNFIFGAGIGSGTEGGGIAWQAHVGGMLVGLLGFSLFDPGRRISNA